MGFSRLFPAAAIVWVALLAAGPVRAGDPVEAFDPAQWEGRVVLLDFWASWCGPCAESFPWMDEMHEKYGPKGLVIVGVNLDANREDADRFLQDHPNGFRQLFDPQGALAESYGVDTMPTSILLDRNGKPVARHRGFRSEEREAYERNLEAVLSGGDLPVTYAEDGSPVEQHGVRPWEKGVLALREMTFELDALELEIDDHIYFSKEASSGGRGFGGGGCGCN
jgi:thiol-disulfide isomerase/thioredoxin